MVHMPVSIGDLLVRDAIVELPESQCVTDDKRQRDGTGLLN